MAAIVWALKWFAYATALGSVTLTPLVGFLVGDRHPSMAATALQMFIAVCLMAASLAVTVIDRAWRRRARAAEIHRRAVARGAGRNPDDRFAATREQAHAAGLPWIESDGLVSWPPRTPEPRP